MNKIRLEKLIYKNYLKTALTSILFIELVLIIIYFNASNNMIKTSMNFVLKDINTNVSEIVQKEMEHIDLKFSKVETIAKILQNEHKVYFQEPHRHFNVNKISFKRASNGILYKEDNGGSSVIVFNNQKITRDLINDIKDTETFDISFKSIVDEGREIVAVYFSSYNNIIRYYPYVKNGHILFPSKMDIKNYNFYYKADLQNNPQKKVVWTDVYLDPLGKGWILSAIVPIYNKEFLEGVTGIDVTIESFIKKFLNLKLPYDGKSFILNQNGKIVAMPKEIEEVFDIEEVSKYNYKKGEVIDGTIYKSEKFNIFNHSNKEIANTLKGLLSNKIGHISLSVDDKKYLLYSKKLDKTPWYIISVISEDKVTEKVMELETDYTRIGYTMITFIIFFYLLFFIFLYSKAKEFVELINKPLLKIIEMTKNLGKKPTVELESCGIDEIDRLNSTFNELSNELDLRTKKLIESEMQRVKNEKLANTDSLTGVNNRRFLKDFSTEYMKIIKREKETLSLLLVDIDNFKTKNDTFGHDIGDQIILKLVNKMREILRDNDLIVRYGGDEFIILLPNTKLSSAKKVGKKLIKSINETNQLESKKLTYTISIGTSTYETSKDDIESMITRADKALYKAKELGRNCLY